ncbi:MAG: hypothetical protein ACT4PI_18875 [Actinomycetota bacterium]
MKIRTLLASSLGALLTLVPGTADAKGAQDATVTGPGLEQPLRLGTQAAAGELAQKAGLYEGLFGSTTVALAASAPAGDLGPRYVAEYRLSAGPDGSVEVRQELYPFAPGGAVTHTPPGQQPIESESSPGGWFPAGAALTDLLVAAGVPAPAGAVISAPRFAG